MKTTAWRTGQDLVESRRIHNCGQPLAVEEEPPVGAHLVTPRHRYCHHGIYVGDGKVVHYAGLSRSLRRGPVEEVPLAHFAGGRGVYVKRYPSPKFDAYEVVTRARSRLGEDCYRLLTNNCEHFCEWCFFGEGRSEQVEHWLRLPRAALPAAASLIRRWIAPRPTVASGNAWAV